MTDLLGLLIAYTMIPVIIAGAQLLLRRGVVSATVARKLIHIGVSHWWLLAMRFHTTAAYAAIGPVTFIVLNSIIARRHLLPAMEDPDHRKNLGTVYFPISLLSLVLLCFAGPIPTFVGGIGVMVMGYGDGLASIIGSRSRKGRLTFLGGSKSLSGSGAMFIASAVVTALWIIGYHPGGNDPAFVVGAAAATALVAASLEFFTPFGLDNLTVPIGTALFFFMVFV